MTRSESTHWILVCLVLVSFLLVAGSGCAQPTPTPTPAPTPTPELDVADLAQKIKAGEIDVGDEYGLAPGQRYHKIHHTVLGLDCTTCHTKPVAAQEAIFSAQDVSPQAPEPVDRKACLDCHQAGPATTLFGGGSP